MPAMSDTTDLHHVRYWNRYPGAQCDVESYIYMPLLEETGYIPKEKYSHGPELLEHAERIAKHYGLYDKAMFFTEVLSIHWQEDAGAWRIVTSHNDDISARHVILCAGPLHRPKLPGIPGLERFEGHMFHSSRFDYGYCGQNLERLADKKVAIIGTGATSIQITPHIGAAAKEFYVFQRTPSHVDERGNRPTTDEFIKEHLSSPGWQKQRQLNFAILSDGGSQDVDLVGDRLSEMFTKISQGMHSTNHTEDKNNVLGGRPPGFVQVEFEKMDSIRKRVDTIVKDKKTAEALKPWFSWICKRPAFHDEYLETFNRSNVTLVHTDGVGIERMTEKSLVYNGKEYEVDLIIFATGFELATEWVQRAGLEVYGRTQPISKKWEDGAVTLHGWGSNGFPNAYFIQAAQTAVSINTCWSIGKQAAHICYIIDEALKRGAKSVEPTEAAENAWVDEVMKYALVRDEMQANCTPGWINNEGVVSDKVKKNWFYGGGLFRFLNTTQKWREDGKLEGLEIKY